MIILTNNITSELSAYLATHKHDKIFVLSDTHTYEKCLPLLADAFSGNGETPVSSYTSGNGETPLSPYTTITIKAGDMHKSIEQVRAVWDTLSKGGASRNSLLINVGGGMVTDLGGFAGATFKRGLHLLHIPTTLMAVVDAAVGGKTGINYNGLKNEIGAFYQPDCVMIDCRFLQTLDFENLLSGYAEMIKHGLISDKKSFYDVLTFNIEQPDFTKLNELVGVSIAIKERFVETDPTEQGIRKALNLGHTAGHAFESLSFQREQPVLHGVAVAAGLICELYLSYKVCRLPVELLRQVTNFIKTYYPPVVFSCNEYEKLYELMMHDKKNEDSRIRFTLLGAIGDVRIHQEVSKSFVFESFDFYRDNIF